MKTKVVNYKMNNELYITSQILNMVCDQYDGKLPDDVMDSLEHTINIAEKHIEKDFEPSVDIKDMQLITRVTFDMDSINKKKEIKTKK